MGTACNMHAPRAVTRATQPLTKAFCSGVKRSNSSGFPSPSKDQSRAGTSGINCVQGRKRGDVIRRKVTLPSRLSVSTASPSASGRRRWRSDVGSGEGFGLATVRTSSFSVVSPAVSAAGGRMQASQMTSLNAQQQVAATVCQSHAKDRFGATAPSMPTSSGKDPRTASMVMLTPAVVRSSPIVALCCQNQARVRQCMHVCSRR
mmetsp:Transcript_48856/g.114834  ORF Transcript_48856/g.114834 Transcript_48856/m.114834 type:complete len:204 (-) Transcript_48856:12-623(-)